MKFLIRLYIFLAPVTGVFALTGWLRVPVMFILFLLFVYTIWILTYGLPKEKLSLYKEDYFLILTLALILISFFIHRGLDRTFNHMLAWSFSIIVYFFFIRHLVNISKLSLEYILRTIWQASIIISIIVISDWILANFFSIYLRSYVVIPEASTMSYYNYSHFGYRYFTTGGVAEEPGTMGVFMNIYIPLAMYYSKRYLNGKSFFILGGLYLFSIIALGSTAMVSFLVIAYLFYQLLLLLTRFRFHKSAIAIFSFLLIIFTTLIIGYSEEFLKTFNYFFSKVLLSENSISASQRVTAWGLAIDNWQTSPFVGNGPGHGKMILHSGYLSVYLTLLAEIGIFALLFFAMFIIRILEKALNIKDRYKLFVFIPVLATILHLGILSDFYHGVFWLLMITIQKLYKETRLEASKI